MSARVFFRRQFLNTDENGGNAFICAQVQEANGKYVEASFDLSDCSRQISLDFGVYSDEQEANVRVKIAKLRKAIIAFEAALLAQLDEREKGE